MVQTILRGADFSYTNNFACIPLETQYRPRRTTPKPVIHGAQTAIVVGPPGEEIYTNEHGQVKVQFHWDREGNKDDKSSCLIRVSQLWAGANWGAMYIPRIDQEVVVDFLEGDPDRPIITGRVYHGINKPPYTLPDEKTKSTIKSDSTPGGGGFNEFRFEDKKGDEEVFLHAEKNNTIEVKADEDHTIGGNHTITIDKDDSKTVKGKQEVTGNGAAGCHGNGCRNHQLPARGHPDRRPIGSDREFRRANLGHRPQRHGQRRQHHFDTLRWYR